MTHQQSVGIARDSERLRIAAALEAERNTNTVTVVNGRALVTSVDAANRKTVVAHDRCSLRMLIAELQRADQMLREDDEPAPETQRGAEWSLARCEMEVANG